MVFKTFFLVISVVITFSFGRVVLQQCPGSSNEESESQWILYGSTSKCYVAGLKGPCSRGEVLVPLSDKSIHGICTVAALTMRRTPGNRQLRKKRYASNEYDSEDDDTAYRITRITRNSCPTGQIYSYRQQQCIASSSSLPI